MVAAATVKVVAGTAEEKPISVEVEEGNKKANEEENEDRDKHELTAESIVRGIATRS